jgi:hypothetical protein
MSSLDRSIPEAVPDLVLGFLLESREVLLLLEVLEGKIELAETLSLGVGFEVLVGGGRAG